MSPRRPPAGLAALVALATALSGGCGGKGPPAPAAGPADAPKAPPKAGVDLTASAKLEAGVLSVSVDLLRDPAAAPVPVTVSVDVYAAERPSHPDRHFAFWVVDLAEPGRTKTVSWTIDVKGKDGRLSLDGKPVTPQTPGVRAGEWKGPFRDGALKGVVAAWRSDDPDHRQVIDLFFLDVEGERLGGFRAVPAKGSF